MSLAPELLAKAPRQTLIAIAHGKTSTYEGRDLEDVLRASGVSTVQTLKAPQLGTVVTIAVRDGYRVVFALAELDPTLGARQAMPAGHVDGAALDTKHGPCRLIVPEDQRAARWVHPMARITVSGSEQ